MSPWRQPGVELAPGEVERRALGLLLEGLVSHQVQVDAEVHRRLESVIKRESATLAEPQAKEEVLARIGAITRAFEGYRSEVEEILDERRKGWQQLAIAILHKLAEIHRIDLESESWKSFTHELSAARRADELKELRSRFLLLLHHHDPAAGLRPAEEAAEEDLSTLNDNAAGLRGGGAALEHIGRMLASRRPGYIAFFRLSCLDVIGERFGNEGIEDCLRTVASFLTEHLRHEDTVYYWNESSLLAVCDRKIREEMISAELQRVLARNRDFTLQINDRSIMMRIPIELQLCPLHQFETADDVVRFSESRNRDRLLAGRF